MQPLTAPPRDSLTVDQVLAIIQGSSNLTVDRGLEVIDYGTRKVIDDITGDFEGGTVSRDCTAVIHGSCNLTIARDIIYGTQYLRPYMTVSGNGLSARFNCGLFVANKPQSVYGDSVLANVVAGLDLTSLLKRPVGDSYQTESGSTFGFEIKSVIAAAGINPAYVRLDGTAADTVMPTVQSWPMLADPSVTNPIPHDASSGQGDATTYLQIVNELLAQINYRGIWADWDGILRCDPWIDPAVRTPEFTFNFDDKFTSIIGRPRTKTRDISNTPNVWIFINTTNPDAQFVAPSDGDGIYTQRNESDGDTSIEARGGFPLGQRVAIFQIGAADQATLVALGDKQIAADKAVATSLSLITSPFPAAWHEDVYLYSDTEMGAASMKVQSTNWVLDFGVDDEPPADMQHTCVQVG